MRPARVYIAGPMTGLPEYNFPAFRAAAIRLREFDFDVISPVEIDHGPGKPGSHSAQHYLRNDLRALIDCDGIALLPGWEQSIGARCEAAVALTLGLAFVDPESGLSFDAPRGVEITCGYPAVSA
jgi:hypothetical protein